MTRSRLIGIALAAIALIALLAFTGPRPPMESSGVLARTGGACLQLEQWGMFGWAIVGQTYTESDIIDAIWHIPPSANPSCQEAPEEEYVVWLPSDAVPDVYRLCGLADELGCLEFRLTSGETIGRP